jgi:prophage antirepressor-like protein
MTQITNLKIGEEHTVRMFENDNDKWFCVVDICNCLGTTTKPANVAKKIDDENKTIQALEMPNGSSINCIFIDETSAYNLIYSSRAKNAKAMKALLFQFIKGQAVKKVKKIKTLETKEDDIDVDNSDITEAFSRTQVPKIKVPESNNAIEPVQPHFQPGKIYISESVAKNPELIIESRNKEIELEKHKMVLDAENQKFKLELENKTKLAQIEAQAKRDSINNKLEFIKHCEFFVKEGLRSYPVSAENKLFLDAHARACLTILQENYADSFKNQSFNGGESGTRSVNRDLY